MTLEEQALVYSVAMWSHHWHVEPTDEQKARLDSVHLAKIDRSDEIFVLDVGGYIGDSTRNEIAHAQSLGIPVRYMSREHPNWSDADARYVQDINITDNPHPYGAAAMPIASLVARFSAALADKLYAKEADRGWAHAWAKTDWRNQCRADLLRHLRKGDPIDVAAYCAFAWHHGWAVQDHPTVCYWDTHDTEAGEMDIADVLDRYGHGVVVGVDHVAVTRTTWHAALPPAADADSDDEWSVEAETEADAQTAMDAEIARRKTDYLP